MRGTTLLAVVAAVALIGGGAGSARGVCGDRVVEADEDCDLGGTCIGGPAAGTACHVGDATCAGGTCTTFGGQGCAANCTAEHDISVTIFSGTVNLTASDFLAIPLPLGGVCTAGANVGKSCGSDVDCPDGVCVPSHQTLTVGKEKDGSIPVVIKVQPVAHGPLPVADLACACVNGIAAKTCGGTLLEADGVTLSPDCTPGFSDDDPCAGRAPCAFVHGAGNSASGTIGCDGLDGADLLVEQDSGGASHVGGPMRLHLSGHGGPGSARLAHTLGITAVTAACSGSDPAIYGPDGIFCTADDPAVEGPPNGIIAVAGTSIEVTGTATAVVHNANGDDGIDLGPVSATGAPFDCGNLECGDSATAAGAGLASAFTFVHLDTVGDQAGTEAVAFAGQVPDPALCCLDLSCRVPTADCDGSGEVTIDEIIILVNIALGAATNDACSGGVPVGWTVDIVFIIKAVGFALYGLPGG